jgi:luciferase family oxidoreductase group 1
MVPFSVLDLSPILEGGDAGQALRNSIDLAQHAEQLGFDRYWLAEHHNMPGIASAATAVVIAHVAQATSTIRVGAGGVMLPNHAPLVIAEQFGTLAALHPGRIDLGLGRAPGSDAVTARALRRTLNSDPDAFPQDVLELLSYFETPKPGQRVRAFPGAGLDVAVWILGSSLFGAQVAAEFGLPFAFASHFAPELLGPAVQIYRQRFKPSARLARPHAMLGLSVIAADTDAEAELLATSQKQAFLRLRRGQPTPLPPPLPGFDDGLEPMERAMLDQVLACAVVGSPQTVQDGLAAFIARTGADELMITAQIFDHRARRRSFEIVAEAHTALGQTAASARTAAE